jgi:polysaccharide export outer membrane protein
LERYIKRVQKFRKKGINPFSKFRPLKYVYLAIETYICKKILFMFKKILIKFFLVSFLVFSLASCVSKSKLLYVQENLASNKTNSFEIAIQPDDVLQISISSENPEVTIPYNMQAVIMMSSRENAAEERRQISYLVDSNGMIDYPVLGKIKMGGLSKNQAVIHLQDLLKEHIKDAIVNIRILNFKLTVLGEVNRPGSFTIPSERITLLEALGQAGDMTIYGSRNNILILRENNGTTTTQRIDITKSDFINSEWYYLRQNDVVYVEPNKTKINSSVVGPNLTIGISALSLLVTIIALSTR